MPLATMSDAHREWHLNSGVPMGQPGCPQDACHIPDFESDEDAEVYFASFRTKPQAPKSKGVKCGNRKVHKTDVVYHASTSAVRDCYMGSHVAQVSPQGAPVTPAPTPAPPARPARISVEEMQTWRTIPVGTRDTAYYALETADHSHVAFFRVRRPSEGKYAGRTYVDQQSGDNFERMTFRETASVLSTIAKNPQAAAVLYGQKIERCAMCHRSLTDDVNKGADGLTSLERGIGPDCAKKIGMV